MKQNKLINKMILNISDTIHYREAQKPIVGI